MKKKLLTTLLCGVMALSLVACGGSNNSTDGGNTSTEKDNVAVENDVTAENDVASTGSVLDVDGVKIPLDSTWEEFQAIVTENNWEYIGNAHTKLGVEKDSAVINVKMGVGEITFNFTSNEDGTEIVFSGIIIDPSLVNYSDKVSINGLTVLTTTASNEVKTFDDCYVQLTPYNLGQESSRITIVIQQ